MKEWDCVVTNQVFLSLMLRLFLNNTWLKTKTKDTLSPNKHSPIPTSSLRIFTTENTGKRGRLNVHSHWKLFHCINFKGNFLTMGILAQVCKTLVEASAISENWIDCNHAFCKSVSVLWKYSHGRWRAKIKVMNWQWDIQPPIPG